MVDVADPALLLYRVFVEDGAVLRFLTIERADNKTIEFVALLGIPNGTVYAKGMYATELVIQSRDDRLLREYLLENARYFRSRVRSDGH